MEKRLEVAKKKLLERKHELEEELYQLSQEKIPQDQVQDPADQVFNMTLEDLNISLQNQEYQEYVILQKALDMIESGTYGICIDCNQEISEKRLQLYPNAMRCITCQQLFEERN